MSLWRIGRGARRLVAPWGLWMRMYLWGLWYVLQKRANFRRAMTLLTRHRRWDNGEVKSSYGQGGGGGKVCLRREGSRGGGGREGGWMCWVWRRVNDAGL